MHVVATSVDAFVQAHARKGTIVVPRLGKLSRLVARRSRHAAPAPATGAAPSRSGADATPPR